MSIITLTLPEVQDDSKGDSSLAGFVFGKGVVISPAVKFYVEQAIYDLLPKPKMGSPEITSLRALLFQMGDDFLDTRVGKDKYISLSQFWFLFEVLKWTHLFGRPVAVFTQHPDPFEGVLVIVSVGELKIPVNMYLDEGVLRIRHFKDDTKMWSKNTLILYTPGTIPA
jgi:hypothetical protein